MNRAAVFPGRPLAELSRTAVQIAIVLGPSVALGAEVATGVVGGGVAVYLLSRGSSSAVR